MAKIMYDVSGTIKEVLHVANEVKSITGMEPVEIVIDDRQHVKFNKNDFRRLVCGNMDEEKYMSRNRIS